MVVLETLLRDRAKWVFDSVDGARGKTAWEVVTEPSLLEEGTEEIYGEF